MENKKIIIRSITDEQGIESKYIEFYPSVFNQRSKQIYENGKLFYEIIETGAFDDVIRDEKLNCKAVVNHDEKNLLARSTSGTLTLEVDEYGLKARVLIGKTNLWNDIIELIERGDLYECSFKAIVKNSDQTFTRDENGNLICRVRKISNLFDVSIVTDAAYSNTNIKLRSLEDFLQQEEIERKALEENKEKIKQDLLNYRNYLNQIKNEITGAN